jgi:spore coat protein CotH
MEDITIQDTATDKQYRLNIDYLNRQLERIFKNVITHVIAGKDKLDLSVKWNTEKSKHHIVILWDLVLPSASKEENIQEMTAWYDRVELFARSLNDQRFTVCNDSFQGHACIEVE